MRKTIVVALGGNALIMEGTEGKIDEQFANARKSMQIVSRLVKAGYRVVLSHGNGPQAGVHLVRNETGEKEGVPASSLNVIVADTQGSIGYMLQQSLYNALLAEGINRVPVTILCQAVVERSDPAMENPTKYVGLYFKEDDLLECRAKGWIMKEDPGRGYRRVVPSPLPVDIVEKSVIKRLVGKNEIVITVGGGGIPVCRQGDGSLEGIDAVIDKDRASALLANLIKADELLILTAVEKVALNYRKPDERRLDRLSVKEARQYLADGHFPPGSMGPKIEAACDFLSRGGKQVVISSLDRAMEAVEGKTGTRILP